MVNTKNIILSIAIAIVFMLLGSYGINLIHAEPNYEDFCDSKFQRAVPLIKEIASCDNSQIIQRQNQCYDQGNTIINSEYDNNGCLINFECSSCNKDFDSSHKKWEGVAFIAAVIFGIVGIVAGAILFTVEAVGSGLMGGGVLTIFVFSMMVWNNLGNLVRFVILLLALVVLIYVGYKINKKKR